MFNVDIFSNLESDSLNYSVPSLQMLLSLIKVMYEKKVGFNLIFLQEI